MKLNELKHGQVVTLDLKVINDQFPTRKQWGKLLKTIVVVDADAEGSEVTALLDLYDDDIKRFKFKEFMKAVNCYAKEITTAKGKQMLITYGFKDGKLQGHYEKVEG